MLIDCHVLTMQGDNAAWRDELRRDLDAEPVRQHWLPGIAGELGRARAAGLEAGGAPFVSWADPDDRIIRGTYGRLLQALQAQPQAPFAWAGEQRVDDDLTPIGQPSVWPGGYDQRRHRNHIFGFCHGVVLIRRAALAPAMPLLRRCGNGAEGILLARLVPSALRWHQATSRCTCPLWGACGASTLVNITAHSARPTERTAIAHWASTRSTCTDRGRRQPHALPAARRKARVRSSADGARPFHRAQFCCSLPNS